MYTKTVWEDLPSKVTKVTATRMNNIESGIFQNTQDIVTVGNKLTANTLKPDLQTSVSNGITCTNNGDRTYTIQPGTASGNAFFPLMHNPTFLGTMKMCGCPAGGSEGTYLLAYTNNTDGAKTDLGNGVATAQYNASTYPNCDIGILIKSGTVISTPLVFKPMLTTNLSATYDDFVPFTGTSGLLNKDVADVREDLDTVSANLSNKFDYISGITGTGAGDIGSLSYPPGFTKDNTMCFACQISLPDGRTIDNVSNGVVVLAFLGGDSGILVHQYSADAAIKTRPYKACLIRTDI